MKFKDAWRTFEKYSNLHHSKGTKSYYKGKIKYLLKFFGDIDVNTINREMVFDFWEYMRDRNPAISPNTLNKYKDVLTFIIKNETGVIISIKDLPEVEQITEVIPRNIIKIIFEYLKGLPNTAINKRNEILFHMLHDTGLRISELLHIRVDDINFSTSTILVKKTKTRKERYTFFEADTHLMLTNYISKYDIEDYIFINFKTKEIMSVNSVETLCSRLGKKLRIGMSISPHKWRHTFGTRFQRKHGDLEVTRRIMGHTNTNTTKKYMHLTRDDLHRVYFRGFDHKE